MPKVFRHARLLSGKTIVSIHSSGGAYSYPDALRGVRIGVRDVLAGAETARRRSVFHSRHGCREGRRPTRVAIGDVDSDGLGPQGSMLETLDPCLACAGIQAEGGRERGVRDASGPGGP